MRCSGDVTRRPVLRRLGPGRRILATIRFSDIVDSTVWVEKLGDRAWTELLRQHNVRIRAAIDRFRGREIGSAGDGFLALFDGAAKAVRAGELMDPSLTDLGIRVRVGVHTGEVEISGGQARGVAVHAAARVASLAGPGEVLVSGTTRERRSASGKTRIRSDERMAAIRRWLRSEDMGNPHGS